MKIYLFVMAAILLFVSCTPEEEYDYFDIDFDSTSTTYRNYQHSYNKLVVVNNVFRAKVTRNGVVIADSDKDSICFYKNNAMTFRINTSNIWLPVIVDSTGYVNFGSDSLAVVARDSASAVIKYNLNRKYKLEFDNLNALLDDSIFTDLPSGLPYSLLTKETSYNDIRKVDSLLATSNEYYSFKKWKAKVKAELVKRYY